MQCKGPVPSRALTLLRPKMNQQGYLVDLNYSALAVPAARRVRLVNASELNLRLASCSAWKAMPPADIY